MGSSATTAERPREAGPGLLAARPDISRDFPGENPGMELAWVASVPTVPRAGMTVLVVESDDRHLRALLDLLSAAGCDVRAAPDAFEACVLLRDFRPRLALVNPQIPLVAQVVDRIRSDGAARL